MKIVNGFMSDTTGNFIVKNNDNNTYLTSNVEPVWSAKRADAMVFDSYIDAGKYKRPNVAVIDIDAGAEVKF